MYSRLANSREMGWKELVMGHSRPAVRNTGLKGESFTVPTPPSKRRIYRNQTRSIRFVVHVQNCTKCIGRPAQEATPLAGLLHCRRGGGPSNSYDESWPRRLAVQP